MSLVSRKSLVLLSLLLASGAARADPSPAGGPTPPVPASSAAPADGPTIAPPAPDASPQKVEEAKAVAKTAELTPLIPNPSDATRPAFQLYAEIDLPLLAVGGVFALARRTKTQPAFCAPTCDSSTLNGLDKLTAGYYSAGWSTASDFELYGIGAAAAALLVLDEGALSALNDAVVVGEATLSATAVASIMTLAAGRPRPFLFGDPTKPDSYKAPLSVRNGGDAGLSFLSSHTAEAFAIVTSLYVAERRLHPGSHRPTYILGAGLAVASLIGLSRVMAGQHFVTDVVGGAVVGSSIGVLVASVHGSPVHVVPVVSETPTGRQGSLAITGSF